MKELVNIIGGEEIQKYIEEKENVKLNLKKVNLKECKKEGHAPHYDTGTSNHMIWCRYSASTLLTKDYKGGEFIFLDDNNNVQQRFNQEYHYGRTLIYDVKHKHMVTPHFDGDRVVDLYFWEVISENKTIPDVIKNYQQNNNSKRFKMF